MASSDQHLQGRRRTNLADLPLEIIQRILTVLPAAERARAAALCRYIATAVVGSEVAGSVWHEATLPPLSDNSFASLLTWAARRSKDLQRLRLSAITTTQGELIVDRTSYAILISLHAVHTLRIDSFHDASAARMCATLLHHCPMSNQMRHLALHGLPLDPDHPQLVAAVQAQSQLVECVLSFSLSFTPSTVAASGKATVLTAAGACSKLQRLCVGQCGSGYQLRTEWIPGDLAALGSLTSLELRRCGLWGPQQLPPNLVDLRLDDDMRTGYTLPASLAAMTAHTRLTANHAQKPPPVWPPRLIFLEVDGWRFHDEEDAALAPPLASLSTVTGLRFLKLDGWEALGYAGICAEELDAGTAPLLALEALSIRNSSLETLPGLSCLSRVTALDLSRAWFSAVPESLRAATACVVLDLSYALGNQGIQDPPSYRILSSLTALRRLSLRGALDHDETVHLVHELREEVQSVKECVLARYDTAEVAISSEDPFSAAVPDPVSFLETEQDWRF